MIFEAQGDLLESPQQTVLCTINCQGAMGAGLAKAVKDRYPHVFDDYLSRYRAGELVVDRLYVTPLDRVRQVLMFPTKDHWRSPSDRDQVQRNLAHLRDHYADYGITSLAMVLPGSGLGGLPSKQVLKWTVEYLDPLPLTVVIYTPPEGDPLPW